jgi:cytidine deaminase
METLQHIKQSIQHKVFLTPEEAQILRTELNLPWEELLFTLLEEIKTRAVMPLADFYVGAIAIADSGNLYFGTSLDFVNTSTAQCIHAEQSAISNAYTHGERAIKTIVVNAPPCGYCRQFMYEIENAQAIEILFPPNQKTTLAQLLPHPFGPADLGVDAGMLTGPVQSLSLNKAKNDPVITAALTAANRSYSPYWQSFAGVAIETNDGQIYSGSYFENAGQNPDLSPMQAALLQLTLRRYPYSAIKRVVLVEADTIQVKHGAVAQDLLQAIGSNCILESYSAASSAADTSKYKAALSASD